MQEDHPHGNYSLTIAIVVQANLGNLHACIPHIETRALIITLRPQNTDYKAFATTTSYA